MKKTYILSVIMACFAFIPALSQYIADYAVAKEEVLRSIPAEYINKARNELVIAYQHTSHGTHVSRGVFGLPGFEGGDEQLFGVATSDQSNKLWFRDYALKSYAPPGVDGSDLSLNETAFIQTTRNFLNAPENADVNVVMWSWCDITGHNVSGNYLPGMTTLISEYGAGGTMIGTGAGQREKSVAFIFMTGHAVKNANIGSGKPANQATLINDYCNINSQYCLDYYSIDSHDMNDNYWEDVSDDGYSDAHGGNFYTEWQNTHILGADYYENLEYPGGPVVFGAHNSQHITANRKAYALWWILARIVGWEEAVSRVEENPALKHSFFPNPCKDLLFIRDIDPAVSEIHLVRSDGVKVCTCIPNGSVTDISLDISGYPPGLYGISMISEKKLHDSGTVIVAR